MRLIWLAVRLWGGLTATILVTLFVGYRQPMPVWTTLVDCQQPCWAGIRSGVTTHTEALRILAHYGAVLHDPNQELLKSDERSAFAFSYLNRPPDGQGYVQDMDIYMLSKVRMGEVIALWGVPDHVATVRFDSRFMGSPAWDSTTDVSCAKWITLEYWQRKVVVEAFVCDQRLTVDTPLEAMFLGSCTLYDPCEGHYHCDNLSSRSPWYGFIGITRYSKDTCVEIQH